MKHVWAEQVFAWEPVAKEWDRVWGDLSVESELEGFHKEALEYDDFHPLFTRYFPKGGRILEGGCGLGKWLITLRKEGFQVEGIDFSKKAVAALKAYDPTIPVVEGSVTKLPYADASFDGYYSGGVVEHIPEGPWSALQEAYRVLRPGGVMINAIPFQNWYRLISYPIRVPLLRLLYVGLQLAKQRRLHFFEYRFTRGQMLAWLEAIGFEIIETIPLMHNHGLYADFPFFRDRSAPYTVTKLGERVARALKRIAPYLAPHAIVYIARKPHRST